MDVKIGCNTVLFASLSLPDALQHVKWAGFDAVEIACLGNARHAWPDFDDSKLQETREALAASGLDVVAMEAATNLLDPEKREWFYSALDLAAALDIPLVSTGSGGADTQEDLERVLAVIPEVAERAEARGVKVSVKAHVHAAVHDVATAQQTAEAANSPWLGINYDPTHLYREGEDILEAWDRLAPHVVHVHFRDLRGGANKEIGAPAFQIPGMGVLDLPPLLKRIISSEYAGALDLEVIGAFDFAAGESMGIAAQSRGYIRRCMEEIEGRSAS